MAPRKALRKSRLCLIAGISLVLSQDKRKSGQVQPVIQKEKVNCAKSTSGLLRKPQKMTVFQSTTL